jgi:diguanylate cyclase (GGDEF)-like protein
MRRLEKAAQKQRKRAILTMLPVSKLDLFDPMPPASKLAFKLVSRFAAETDRLYPLKLISGVLGFGVAVAFTSGYWLPLFDSGASPNRPASLHVIAEMVLTISFFILAAAFTSMYRKSRGLLSFRGIFLVFALFAAASGVTRILGLFEFGHREVRFAAQWEMISATLAVVSAGIVAALVGRTRDFLALAQQSRRNEAMFLAAAENSLEALYTLASVRDKSGEIIDFRYTYINSNGEKLVGLPRESIVGQYLGALVPVNRTGGFFEEYKQVAITGQPMVQEFPMQQGDEIPRWIRHEVVRLEDGIAITAADITERKLSEQATQHRAQHDTLTGLPNRSLLSDRMQQAIDRAVRYRHKVGLFMVDMDNFKEINDSLGHAAGDKVLVTVAQRLRESVRATDSVLRIGGDEFIVVMPDVQEDRDIRRMAAKIVAAILNDGPPGMEQVHMSCSIGIAVYPVQAATTDELFSKADAAMYQAKRAGGGCFEVYSESTPEFAPPSGFVPKLPVVPPRRAAGATTARVVPRSSKATVTSPET